MNDRASSLRPIAWAVASAHNIAGAAADLRAFDAFAVQGRVATTRGTASNANEVLAPAMSCDMPLAAQIDALMQGPQPAAVKTGLPHSTGDLQALVRCIDRLRAQDPLLAVVVDAQVSAGIDEPGLLDAWVAELLPRATLVALRPADAAALLMRSSGVDDAATQDAARSLQTRADCKGVVIHHVGMSGHEIAREFMVTEQAIGWLLPSPAAAAMPPPTTVALADRRAGFAASAAAALARGFVCADAVVLARMATTRFQRGNRLLGNGANAHDADSGFALERANLPALLSSRSEPSIRFAPLLQPRMDLYAVVDSATWVQRVLDGGVRTVQLRIKDPAHPKLRDDIRASVAAAKAAQAQLFINDHWQLALEENAYGVHLGQEDLAIADLAKLAAAGLRLGLSTHAYWEVCRATALQPSYIACGPIHPTAAKAMPWIPQGNDNLAYWCALLREPVVAIAGMDFERAAQAVQCGASSVAVISGITAADSPEQAMQGFADSMASAGRLPRLPPPDLPRPTLARTA